MILASTFDDYPKVLFLTWQYEPNKTNDDRVELLALSTVYILLRFIENTQTIKKEIHGAHLVRVIYI